MMIVKNIISVIKTSIVIVWYALSMVNIQLSDIQHKNWIMVSYGIILLPAFISEIDKKKYFISSEITEQQIANITYITLISLSTLINLYYWKTSIYVLKNLLFLS